MKAVSGATCALPLAAFVFLLTAQLNHDVAWLLEATKRWVNGAELYHDIIEINPPLIFFDNILLTGGLLTKSAYLAGTCLAIAVSSIWVARWRGLWTSLIVSASLTLPAISDFGQRDHLALIFLAPFLLAPDTPRRERAALGIWAFLGVGLKPHFGLIPVFFIAAQWVFEKRSPLQLQNLVLAGLCIGLIVTTGVVWPHYFTEIIPLGWEVYDYYGGILGTPALVSSLAVALVGLVALFRRESFGAAIWAALAVYFLQGKFWQYQLIPVLGLGAIYALSVPWLRVIGLGLLAVGPWIGPTRYTAPPIPKGPVLFLADRVSAAYPAVFECGAVNASRYPTFWTLPGAIRSNNHRRFYEAVKNLNSDIRRYKPQVIYEDTKLGRIGKSFQLADWADLVNYRRIGTWERYVVWIRKDATLSGPICPALTSD